MERDIKTVGDLIDILMPFPRTTLVAGTWQGEVRPVRSVELTEARFDETVAIVEMVVLDVE